MLCAMITPVDKADIDLYRFEIVAEMAKPPKDDTIQLAAERTIHDQRQGEQKARLAADAYLAPLRSNPNR